MSRAVRNLVVVLGDQLDHGAAVFDGFDAARDVVWMAEVSGEAEQVWSHKARIAIFLAAMRHFRDELRARGFTVDYRQMDVGPSGLPARLPGQDQDAPATLGQALGESVRQLRPQRVRVVEPGEWRVREELRRAVPGLEILTDRHFLCTTEEFAAYAGGRQQLRLEFFYRQMRRQHGVLMAGDQPVGGAWNFDAENRRAFGRSGPGAVPVPRAFAPDAVTREVLELVERKFAGHPGRLERFDWPVTRQQALAALEDFVAQRLPAFGRYQDAMWTREPYLYHSRLSAALNLKLLNPREVIAAAVQAYERRQAGLPAVEGFVRQVLGWREYVRGIYWRYMPEYAERNALGAERPLPAFYWTGATEMNCLREVIGQTLEYGYAHHIQRLMVTGLYALLLGVNPVAVHRWYLAVYVDAVEWVELPNVLGMSQYADGGLMASKPYVASGRYIERMSNYCEGCRFKPGQASGAEACPFTTLYWDFLMRHERWLRRNPRMSMPLKNLDRLGAAQRAAIRRQAEVIRGEHGRGFETRRSG